MPVAAAGRRGDSMHSDVVRFRPRADGGRARGVVGGTGPDAGRDGLKCLLGAAGRCRRRGVL